MELKVWMIKPTPYFKNESEVDRQVNVEKRIHLNTLFVSSAQSQRLQSSLHLTCPSERCANLTNHLSLSLTFSIYSLLDRWSSFWSDSQFDSGTDAVSVNFQLQIAEFKVQRGDLIGPLIRHYCIRTTTGLPCQASRVCLKVTPAPPARCCRRVPLYGD